MVTASDLRRSLNRAKSKEQRERAQLNFSLVSDYCCTSHQIIYKSAHRECRGSCADILAS